MPLDVAHPSAPQYPPEGLVPSYAQLRTELASGTAACAEKSMSLEDATALVNDGDTVGIGGSTMSRTPMGMIWALIRARKTRLSCVRSIVSSDGDLALRLGHLRSHHHQLVQPGNPVGCVQSDAPPRGDRRRGLRRVESHGDRHALSRRGHGTAVHADPIDAWLGRRPAAA